MIYYIVGALLIIFSALDYFLYSPRFKRKVEVEALVLKTEKVIGLETGDRYYSSFQYSIDGKQYETRCSTGSVEYTEGTVARIYCYSGDHSEITISSMVNLHRFINWIVIIFGIGIIIYKAFS